MNKKILIITGAGLILVLIAALLLFKRYEKRNSANKVADLTYIKNIVESRYSGRIEWKSADLNENLFDEDSVKTHSNSEAVVTFIDNASVRVDQNSIIVIKKIEKNAAFGDIPTFEIINGRVEASAVNRINITTPKGTSTILPVEGKSKVAIEVQKDKKTKISVLQGKSVASVGNKTVEVKSGEGIEVDENIQDVVTLLNAPEVVGPTDGEIYRYWGTQLPEISFEFAKLPQTYHLQIAQDPSFNRIVYNTFSINNIVKLKSLSKGEYYWHVAAVDNKNFHGLFSAKRKIKILLDEALKPGATAKPGQTPTPIPSKTPPPESKITPKAIPLKVSRSEGSPFISRKGAKKSISKKWNIRTGDQLNVPYGSHVELSFIAERSLVVREGSNLKVNSVMTRGGFKTLEATLNSGTVIVNAQKISGNDVEFIIKSKRNAVTITTRKMRGSLAMVAVKSHSDGTLEVIGLEGKVETTVAGRQVTVNANTYLKVPSKVSDKNRLKPDKSPVSDITADYGTKTRLFYNTEPPLLTFRWEKGSGSYFFELSNTSNFKRKIISEMTFSRHFTMFAPKPGTYYWRYKSKKGKFSKPQQIAVVKLTGNAAQARKEVISEEDKNPTIVFSQKPPVIDLKWKLTQGARFYEVGIFTDSAMKNRIYSKTVSKTSLSFLADFFKEGKYFWRVNRLANESKIIKQGKRKWFTLKLNNESPTLKIDMPVHNSYAISNEIFTRGDMFKKGSLWIAGQKIADGRSGPFDYKIKIPADSKEIVYKEVNADGTVSYYLRNIIKKK